MSLKLPTHWLLFTALAFVLAGCATAPSGTIGGMVVPDDSTVALISTPFYPYDAFDLDGSFLQLLRDYKLTPVSDKDAPFTVQIGFTQPDDASVVCSLVLLHKGKTVISVSATNRDWSKHSPDASSDAERRADLRIDAFKAAMRNFAAKARGTS